MAERMPSCFREGLWQKPDTRGTHRVPLKASGLQRLLAVLESEPFEEILPQPSLGTSQPVEVSQVVIPNIS